MVRVESPVRLLAFVVAIFAAILLLFGLLGSWFIVDQGDRGVVLRNGAFVRVAEPGLGFKWPIIESVHDLSVRSHKAVFQKLTSYSRDIQLAELRIAVNYRIDAGSVRSVYEKYGSIEAAIDRVLAPRVFDEVKVVFGRFNASTAIQERGRLGVEIEQALRKSVENSGILLESAQLEEIDFSKAFEQSIEDRMKAEVQVATLLQNLEREKVQANIARTQAQGRADSALAVAKADAEAIKLKGEAEAAAIRSRAHALQQNAALIELVKAERWNGALPTTMLPNSGTPLLQIK